MSQIEAEGLALTVSGRTILENINIGIGEGEFIGLIGANGAGKSSLLRALAGLQQVSAGNVRYQGQAMQAMDQSTRARFIGYLPQQAPLHWDLTVESVVALGRLPWRDWWRGDSDAEHAIEHALQVAELNELRNRTVENLSGGERMRVMLARLFAGTPNVVLADEPTAALDAYHQIQVMELLRAHADKGGAVIAVLHDLVLGARFCDRLVLLDHGRVEANDVPERVLDEERLRKCYGVDVRRIECDGEVLVVPWRRAGSRAPDHG